MEVDCSYALLLVPEYEPLRDVGQALSTEFMLGY